MTYKGYTINAVKTARLGWYAEYIGGKEDGQTFFYYDEATAVKHAKELIDCIERGF